MLNYDEFKRELLKRVREKAGRDVTVEIVAIQKNNRTKKDAIAFSDKENNLQPLIYLDSIYSQYRAGAELSVCVGFTVEVYRSAMEIDIDMAYKEWKDVRGKIEMTVINKAWNADAISGIPHMDFLDLVLYCRVIIDKNENGVASTIVQNHMLKEWGISEEALWETAFSNLKTEEFDIKDLNEVLRFIFPKGDLTGLPDKNKFESALYVLQINIRTGARSECSGQTCWKSSLIGVVAIFIYYPVRFMKVRPVSPHKLTKGEGCN